MAHTGTPAPRFTAHQAVEVFVRDFEVAGFPQVWLSATVVEVAPIADSKLSDVTTCDERGTVRVLRVGPRGGGRVVRAA